MFVSMKRFVLLMAALLSVAGCAWAQLRTVTGVVTSAEDGSTLPQLAVQIKGTGTGVVTDLDGRYSIQVSGPETVLLFAYVGMQTQEIPVGDRTTIDVVMMPENKEIGQVVVLGYGTRGKNQVTGSSVQVSGSQMAEIPVVSPMEALQGKVPGLLSNMSSSTPGSTQQIRIRGTGSLTASNTPLYVIDGVPVNTEYFQATTASSTLSPLATLNMNDIESMTLLKDASATAAYGARGSNGVIVIKTKSGRKGTTNFNFAGHWGATIRTPNIPMMSAQQQLETYALALRNAAFFKALEGNKALNNEYQTGTLSEASMQQVQAIWNSIPEQKFFENQLLATDPVIKAWGEAGRPEYDFQKEVDRKLANTFNGVLSASGGGDQYTFHTSIGTNYTQSLVKGSDFRRINGTLNFTRQFTKWLEFNSNTTASYTKQDGVINEQAAYFSNPLVAKYLVRPFINPYLPDGSPNPSLGGSVYSWLIAKDKDISWQSIARGFSNNSLTVEPIKGLKFKTRISLDYSHWDSKRFGSSQYGQFVRQKGLSQRFQSVTFNWVTQNSVSYDFTVQEDHNISLLALQEFQKNNYDYLGGEATTTPTDKLSNLSSFSAEKNVLGYYQDWANAAYLLMANYDYKGRYILDLTYRREGSSRFPSDRRWGNFGSVGVAWNIHSESFFEPVQRIVNRLRLRASYGISGNADIDLNSYQNLIQFEESYTNQPAGLFGSYGNDKLTWEKNATLDLGLEWGVLDDLITGSVTFFNKRTSDLLQEVPISRTTGFSTAIRNVGVMTNRGVEVQMDFAILRAPNYHINLGLNLATLRNRVNELAKDADKNPIGIEGSRKRTDEGHKLDEWYLRQWAGVSPQTGLPLWYTDESRTTTTTDINLAKRVWTGYSALPTYSGGISLHADFWGVYLDANLYFVGGHKIMNGATGLMYEDGGRSVRQFRAPQDMYGNTWTKPGDKTKMPILANGVTHNGHSGESDRFLVRGDYFRLKDVTLGYNVPKQYLSRIHYSGTLAVYAKATNLFTHAFDKNINYDPEVRVSGLWGFSNPPTRVFSVGLNMNF